MGESLDQLKDSFIEETRELINDLENILLSIDSESVDSNVIDQIFRIVHTIKGSGGMLGYENILALTHELEDIYDAVRSGGMEFTSQLKDLSLETIDVLKFLIIEDEKLSVDQKFRYDKLHKAIQSMAGKKSKGDSTSSLSLNEEKEEQPFVTYFIKFVPGKIIPEYLSHPVYLIEELSLVGRSIVFTLDGLKFSMNKFADISPKAKWAVILSTQEDVSYIEDIFDLVQYDADVEISEIIEGELLGIEAARNEFESYSKQIFRKNIEELQKAALKYTKQLHELNGGSKKEKEANDSNSSNSKIIKSIRVGTEQIDQLMNLVSEMVTLQARLNLLSDQIDDTELTAVAEKYASFSKQLRDNAYTISLVPFGVTLTRYKRLVHDLSEQLQKKVDFITEGEDTVLDKKIIEQLADPIMHILRNCIDHGLESPEERIAAGKESVGKILMTVYHKSNNVHIKISDDGAGIDPDKIRRIAIEKGLIEADAHLSRNEIINLIFVPGFSSAEKISNVSGRGVGLDVAKRNISEIRGVVEVNTEEGKGTEFTVILPLTLSIIDGLQVRIEDRDFIVPLMQVDKILTVTNFEQDKKFNQFLEFEGKQIPYFNLRKDFEIQGKAPERQEIVLVGYGKEQVALIVDYVVGENQTVLKPMGRHFKNQDFISGGTILGDGSVALVLDVNKIVIEFSKK